MPQKESKGNIIIKLVLFIFVMLAILLFPAGTFNWPEAWLYLLINICYFIPTFLYLKKHNPELLKRRAKIKPEKGWDMVITVAASILFIPMFVITGLDAVRFGWSLVPVELKVVGFVGIIFSFIILFLVMRENAYLFRVVKVQKGQKLVTTGPYSIVRHPMYVAVMTQFTCIPLALGSFYGLIPAIIIDIFIVIRTYLEDKTLLKELKGYKKYAKKTSYRLLPGVW
ncbi:MAG: isoprenylcysteine carboxylmethyltransferase family protein [Candidatus Bathyarchaeota archaeon]|nr:isoprenylcysteine carboxylmethyltransferase family protein [Candidatus Bathyarchaeota archaeon]